jgi:hypothetical protein
MKRMMTLILILFALSVSAPVIAGPNYIYGYMTNFTTTKDGLLFTIDNGIPDNCSGSPNGIMIISQEDKTMLAMALMKISQEELGATLYSDGTRLAGYCRVTQYDPN